MTRRLAAPLAGVMLGQSATGLLFADRYRDAGWITAAWWGNDWVTLVVAVPLLVLGVAGEARGSLRGRLLWLGILAFSIYNYAYYLFGAALNVFFPFYLCALLLAACAFVASLTTLDIAEVANRVDVATPVRAVGASFTFLGISLAVVWLTMWAAHAFAGRPTPVDPEAFKLVAALDTVLMAPALTLGGTWLWRRNPWGYVLACIAGVQASMYLLVLAVNALVFLHRGLAEPPGELPIWGTLALATAAMTLLLFWNVDRKLSNIP